MADETYKGEFYCVKCKEKLEITHRMRRPFNLTDIKLASTVDCGKQIDTLWIPSTERLCETSRMQ